METLRENTLLTSDRETPYLSHCQWLQQRVSRVWVWGSTSGGLVSGVLCLGWSSALQCELEVSMWPGNTVFCSPDSLISEVGNNGSLVFISA